MEQSLNATASGSACPTPERLVGPVDQRDREWGQWETDAIQSVVNQAAGILAANYPGKGWFRITLAKPYYGDNTHGWLVYNALWSAFGQKLEGVRNALSEVFTGKQWHVVTKYDNGSLIFLFLPKSEQGSLSWRQRRGWWLSVVAEISVNLDVNAVRVPPSTLRPNRRDVNNHSIDGITTDGGGAHAHTVEQAFPYINLC